MRAHTHTQAGDLGWVWVWFGLGLSFESWFRLGYWLHPGCGFRGSWWRQAQGTVSEWVWGARTRARGLVGEGIIPAAGDGEHTYVYMYICVLHK